MSPPTPEQEDSALAALTGTITERKPVTDLDRTLLRLRLVAEAKDRGISWTVIGRTLGCSGKEAHRRMKQLAAQTQRDLVAARNREAGFVPPKRGRARTPRRGAAPKPAAAGVFADPAVVAAVAELRQKERLSGSPRHRNR